MEKQLASATAKTEEDQNQNITYKSRLENELKRYSDKVNIHELPDIAHYWSNRYLSIYVKTLGYKSIRDIHFQHCKEACQTQEEARFCSIGAGNCEVEVLLAKQLVESGLTNFTFECLDINRNMLDRGIEKALKLGVADYIKSTITDLNSWTIERKYDVVFALQCLHHFVELEIITQKIYNGLRDSGFFITHDMIGRNGHQRWPETLEKVRFFWQDLPSRYKFNHHSKQIEEEFINRDFSKDNFEGIRAQDILPLLQKKFCFQTFVFWGGFIDPFISRAFGHNYDAKKPEDRAIIDKIQKLNEDLLISKTIKPTQMIATMKKTVSSRKFFLYGLPPAACIRHVN